MTQALIALVAGLVLLVWSADRFVDGAATTARYFGMPPLLIGMLIVGFGTSAPELLVSTLASVDGNTGIALGNAFGSNIANIALILGICALISPIQFHSSVLRKELPILTLVTIVTIGLIADLELSLMDSVSLLLLFMALVGWTIIQGIRNKPDTLANEIETDLQNSTLSIRQAIFRLILGLALLIASSRILVWGAVEIATRLGVSDMIIGLTIVAVGTSLPELASSIVATKKGEDDIALGNVLGSNLLNTLAVVGIAGVIHPSVIAPETLTRDMTVMGGSPCHCFSSVSAFGVGSDASIAWKVPVWCWSTSLIPPGSFFPC